VRSERSFWCCGRRGLWSRDDEVREKKEDRDIALLMLCFNGFSSVDVVVGSCNQQRL